MKIVVIGGTGLIGSKVAGPDTFRIDEVDDSTLVPADGALVGEIERRLAAA